MSLSRLHLRLSPACSRSNISASSRLTVRALSHKMKASLSLTCRFLSSASSNDSVSQSASSASSSSSLSLPYSPGIPLCKPSFVTASENRFDLIVIGSGPAGQKAAINAAKMKKRVCIVDKRAMLGGVCIHTGTVPSKTFREAILYLTGYRQRGFYGKGNIRRDQIHSADILDRVRKVEGWEAETVLDQLHRNDIMIIDGTARFVDDHHLEVTPSDTSSKEPWLVTPPTFEKASGLTTDGLQLIRGDHILVCCGTRPAHNSMYPFHSPLVFDSDAILQTRNWDKVRHLIVVGSGVIAIEYASMFNALPGCRVTIIDDKPSFLDFVDSEVVMTLRHILGRQGAIFRLGEKINKVETTDNSVTVSMESGKVAVGDALFYAVGRQANTDTLSLPNAGVQLAKRGLISVNDHFQTNVPHIYAAGDVIGFPALASTAMEQGRLCSNHMFGEATTFNPVFPYGIYTIPEISVIGASEQSLTRDRIPYEVGKAKFEEIAKGQMVGGQYIDGFLKLLFCPNTKKLLGAACIGESAAEIIHIAQVVLSMGGTIEYFRDSVFNYPTMAETYRVAALDGLGRIKNH